MTSSFSADAVSVDNSGDRVGSGAIVPNALSAGGVAFPSVLSGVSAGDVDAGVVAVVVVAVVVVVVLAPGAGLCAGVLVVQPFAVEPGGHLCDFAVATGLQWSWRAACRARLEPRGALVPVVHPGRWRGFDVATVVGVAVVAVVVVGVVSVVVSVAVVDVVTVDVVVVVVVVGVVSVVVGVVVVDVGVVVVVVVVGVVVVVVVDGVPPSAKPGESSDAAATPSTAAAVPAQRCLSACGGLISNDWCGRERSSSGGVRRVPYRPTPANAARRSLGLSQHRPSSLGSRREFAGSSELIAAGFRELGEAGRRQRGLDLQVALLFRRDQKQSSWVGDLDARRLVRCERRGLD